MSDSTARSNESAEDLEFMNRALDLARSAADLGEIPVGAIVVRHLPSGPMVVGEGFNRREKDHDPTAHAEIVALRRAGEKLGYWQLTDCDLYVTLEPCPMCAGALVNARIRRLIYGCSDPKAGAVQTLYQITGDSRLNHRVQVRGGIMAQQAAELLQKFFALRRSV
jgi:tRNA(adenine34) deaminase